MDDADPLALEAWKIEDIAPPLAPSDGWMVWVWLSVALLLCLVWIGAVLIRRWMQRFGSSPGAIRRRRLKRIHKLAELLDRSVNEPEASVYLSVWDEYCRLAGIQDGVPSNNESDTDHMERPMDVSDPDWVGLGIEPDSAESKGLTRLQSWNEMIRFNRGWSEAKVRTQAIRELRLLLEHLSRMDQRGK